MLLCGCEIWKVTEEVSPTNANCEKILTRYHTSYDLNPDKVVEVDRLHIEQNTRRHHQVGA